MPSTQTDRIFGLSSSVAVKAPCRVATVGGDISSTLASGGLITLDGITLNANDRVLVKDQTTQSQNGIYVASTAPWVRDADADGNNDLVQGSIVYVTSGTLNGNAWWQQTTAGTITVGTSPIVFSLTNMAGPAGGALVGTYPNPSLATLHDPGLAAYRAVRSNQVVMARNADSTNSGSGANWTVYKPDGTVLNTTGTTTMGLQEAINYAVEFGFDLLVYGGTNKPGSWPGPFNPSVTPGDNPSIITCTTGIVWPSVEQGRFRLQSVTLLFTNAVTGNCWLWDSCMAMDFAWEGGQLIVTNTAANGVYWKPTNDLAIDTHGPVVTTSRFKFPSIVMPAASAGNCATLDDTNAPIQESFFEFIEPNGGVAGVVLAGAAAKGVMNNNVKVVSCHSQTSYCVRVGSSTAAGSTVFGNIFDVDCEPAAAGVGVDIFGSNNLIRASVSNLIGAPATGVKLESTAAQNQIVAGRCDATTPLQDISTARNNAFEFGNDAASVNLGGAAQSIPTGAFTKVAFSTKEFDRMSTFDAVTNHRWTPGVPGVGEISVGLNFSASMTAGTAIIAAIYKNGAGIRNHYLIVGSTGANQGAAFSSLVTIDNATDYFEIYVFQNGAGAANLDGTATNTFATFARLR